MTTCVHTAMIRANYPRQRFGNPQHGRGGRRGTYRYHEEKRMKSSLVTAGDLLCDIPEYLLSLAEPHLLALYQQYAASAVETILECVKAVPYKIGIYSSLVGLVTQQIEISGNIRQPTARRRPEEEEDEEEGKRAGGEGSAWLRLLMRQLTFDLEIHLKRAEYRKAIMLTRFACALMGAHVLTPASVFDLLDAVINSSVKHEPGTCPQPEAVDMPVFIVLSSIPWFSRRHFEEHGPRICAYIEYAGQYVKQRKCPWKKAVEVLRETGDEVPADRLDTLVDAVKTMMQANWQSKATVRFYQQSQLALALEPPPGLSHHVMLPLTLPNIEGNDFVVNYRPIASTLRLPVTTDAVAQPLAKHDRWLVEDHVIWLMEAFQDNVDLCASMLVKIPVADEQFDYILIETVLSEMLRLPKCCDASRPSDCSVFYFVLLQKLMKLMPQYQQIVQKAVHSMVNRIVDFDDEAFEILSEFLGYWLSSTNCEWAFGNWLSVSKPAAPLIRFVRRSMENLVTLVWRESVLSHVPEYVHEYVAPVSSPSCLWLAKQNNEQTEDRKVPIEFVALRQLMKFNLDYNDAYRQNQQSRVACFLVRIISRPHLTQLPMQYLAASERNSSIAVDAAARRGGGGGEEMRGGGGGAVVKSEVKQEDTEGTAAGGGGGGACKRARVEQVSADVEGDMIAEGGGGEVGGGEGGGGRTGGSTGGEEGEGMVVDYADDDEEYHQKHSTTAPTTTTTTTRPPTTGDVELLEVFGPPAVLAELTEASFVEFVAAAEERADDGWSHTEVVELFLKALLCQGIKSDTHLIRLVENYGFVLMLLRPSYLRNKSLNVLRRCNLNASLDCLCCPPLLSQTEESSADEHQDGFGSDRYFYQTIVATVYQFWNNSPQKICLCLNRLLLSGVIPYDCIIDYALFAVQDDLLDELREWYIIRMVLREVVELESSAEYTLRAHKRLLVKTEEQMEHLSEKATRSQCRVQQLVHYLLAGLSKKVQEVPAEKVQLRKHLLLRLLAYGRKFSAYVDMKELTDELGEGLPAAISHVVELIGVTQRYYKAPGAATTAVRNIDPTTLTAANADVGITE
eukprot:GHVS01012222.1.p1 GENE.GHVS01012222.1~~GHVS01012222.1.p1  ORF type:complete len:1075 (-),score=230.50 GHVS01012222.1:406-3630(-)